MIFRVQLNILFPGLPSFNALIQGKKVRAEWYQKHHHRLVGQPTDAEMHLEPAMGLGNAVLLEVALLTKPRWFAT